MQNLSSFLDFIGEGIIGRLDLDETSPMEIIFTPHSLERMSKRDNDNDQSRWRKITMREGEEIIRSQKREILMTCMTQPINSTVEDKFPDEWHFSIRVKSDRFGYLLQDTNFMIAVRKSLKAMKWIVTVKTFKIDKNWTDRGRDYVIFV